MSNSYYNAGSFPATGTPATSASMRAELALISGGFDRLPALSGNANKLVLINGAETGMTVLTPPAGDLVGTTATQTLTNKTISGTFTGSLTGAASLNVLKAGDTMTGNLVINTGVDSRVLLQSSGTTQGQIQTTGALVRFASNNALPLVLSTNGVDRATLDDVGNIIFGSASATGVFKVQGNNTNDLAVFESTDASASAAPDVVLYRNSASPAVSDQIGVLIWRGKDSGGADQQYARLGAEITDPTAGSEDADLWFETTGAGVAAERMRLNAAGLSLASTSDLTLNKGTANGILYLNGSKVATSGSALTFDGTNFTTTGYAAGNGIRSLSGNPVRFYNSLNSNWSQIIAPAGTGDMQFDTGAGEQMRLTSTGLGIGTSSPVGRLTLQGASGTSGINQGIGLLYSNGTQFGALGLNNSSGWPQFMARANAGLTFHVNSDLVTTGEAMRLDPSGNLGLGVTPSAWSAGSTAFQNSAGSIWRFGTNNIYFGQNYYWNGTNRIYSTTNAATEYEQGVGSHKWYTAPSGTAGNAITFTQAMTLDASGRLGVGITSPNYTFETAFDAAVTAGSCTALLSAEGGTAASVGAVTNHALLFKTNNTERMRLDSSGNLGLGVTPSGWSGYRAAQIGTGASFGGYIGDVLSFMGSNTYNDNTNWRYIVSGNAAARYWQSAGAHAWFTAPSGTAGNAITFTQSMTLDAGGKLSLGTASAPGGGGVQAVISNVNGGGLQFDQSGSGGAILPNGGSAGLQFYSYTGGVGTESYTERARITSTGNQIDYQPAESAQNTSVTLTAANLQARVITSNAAVTLTLPTGTGLESYTAGMVVDTAFEVTFIATTANAITIAANGNTTVGNLTVSGNTSGTFRFRKTATNTFTVYRIS